MNSLESLFSRMGSSLQRSVQVQLSYAIAALLDQYQVDTVSRLLFAQR